ncbi:helix-turn-helix domain-containing protein [Sunxiuqinia sp. sy24]|uniref:helix-turn-helix domain-containing protein n=1 Tax=Sunxiuqinia sp. sy24 TaxID=3461495 RepID=UPI0040468694
MTNMNTHYRIKELRETKGLSQEELSEKTGVSLRTIQRIESGESVPRGSTLRTITSSLDVAPDYFSTIPLGERTDTIELVESKLQRFKIRFPWYLFGFTFIGGALGFLVGVLIMIMQLVPEKNHEGMLALAITILFGSIGLVIGNYIEKKNK